LNAVMPEAACGWTRAPTLALAKQTAATIAIALRARLRFSSYKLTFELLVERRDGSKPLS